MAMLRTFFSKLNSLFNRSAEKKEFNEEVGEHVQMLTERYVRSGLSQQEAEAAARKQFGNMTLLEQQQHDGRSFMGLAIVLRDLKYGARQLARNPLFTLIAVVSLALGVGANTAIFSAAKSVLLDTLPVSQPQQLRMLTWVSGPERPVPPIWGDLTSTPSGLRSNSFSYAAYEAMRAQTQSFESILAFKDMEVTATIDGHADVLNTEMLSGGAFSTLGIAPQVGRPITAADDASEGSGPVVVISDAFWASRFGRAANVIGHTIQLNGTPMTIVGVAPAGFRGLETGDPVALFFPLSMQPLVLPKAQRIGDKRDSLLTNTQSWWLQVMVRLRSDVPEAQAQAQMDGALRSAALATVAHTKSLDTLHLKFENGARGYDTLQDEFAQPSYVLMALAGLVLLLACVNLANLLLARGASRQREISTRIALGATGGQILRQLLTESLLLASLGGVAGMLLGYLCRNAIPAQLGNMGHDTGIRPNFDWSVLAFTAGISIFTGLLFGIAPALQAMRVNVNASLKDSGNSTGGRNKLRLGKSLVVTQVALSAILLIGAGLFVHTLVNLINRPLGFSADHILMFTINPPRNRYNDAQSTAMYQQLEQKFAAIPGVRSESMSGIAIIGDGGSGSTFRYQGEPESAARRIQSMGVSADYFSTLRIPLVAGRTFSNSVDTPGAPTAAVINQALADKYFHHQNPVGQMFLTDEEDAPNPIHIVGVVANTRYDDLRNETPPTMFLLYTQQTGSGRMVFALRTAAAPASVLTQVRAAVEQVDATLPLIDVRTMDEQIAGSLSSQRIFARLTSAFGVLALVLAAIGIYGVMAYNVATRTKEIGLRMALGAKRESVIWMVLRETFGIVGTGLMVGALLSLLLGHLIASQLYGVQTLDALTYALTAILLAAVALLSGFIPARRASAIDPLKTLRYE